jgi:hypothetical protein
MPQPPQCAEFVEKSTHCPPHTFCPAAVHAHVPLEHVCPAPHGALQAPQFSASAVTSMHAAPHAMRPWPHSLEHAPRLQKRPAPHAVPHCPQLAGFDWRSVQTPPHDVYAPRHAQLPLRHSCPAAQAMPQAPQCSGSLVRSRHDAGPQSSRPLPQTPSSPESGSGAAAGPQLTAAANGPSAAKRTTTAFSVRSRTRARVVMADLAGSLNG